MSEFKKDEKQKKRQIVIKDSFTELEGQIREFMIEIALKRQGEIARSDDEELAPSPYSPSQRAELTAMSKEDISRRITGEMEEGNDPLKIFQMYIRRLTYAYGSGEVSTRKEFDEAISQCAIGIAYLGRINTPVPKILDVLLTTENYQKDILKKIIACTLFQSGLITEQQVRLEMSARGIAVDGSLLEYPDFEEEENDDEETYPPNFEAEFHDLIAIEKIHIPSDISPSSEIDLYVRRAVLKDIKTKALLIGDYGDPNSEKRHYFNLTQDPLLMFKDYISRQDLCEKKEGPNFVNDITHCKIGIAYLLYNGVSPEKTCMAVFNHRSFTREGNAVLAATIATKALLESGISESIVKSEWKKLKMSDSSNRSSSSSTSASSSSPPLDQKKLPPIARDSPIHSGESSPSRLFSTDNSTSLSSSETQDKPSPGNGR